MVHTTKLTERFTQIPNSTLCDIRLTPKARGILGFMLSMPSNWRFSIVKIAKQNKIGIKAADTAVKELITHGYVVVVKQPNKGRFGEIDYAVFPFPQTQKEST